MKLPIRLARSASVSLSVACEPFGRQILRRPLIAREQVEHDLFGIAHDPHHPRMAVHSLLQEGLDLGFLPRRLRRKSNQRLVVLAHVIGRLRLRRSQPPAGLRRSRPRSDMRSVRAQIRRRACCHREPDSAAAISAMISAASGITWRSSTRKQAGAQAIIDVVGVIGDVVGDRRDLGFQRGKAPQFQIAGRRCSPEIADGNAALAVTPERRAVALLSAGRYA